MKYQFKEIEKCDMCGNPHSNNRLMGQRLNASQGFKPKNVSGISTSIFQCSSCKLIYSAPMPIPDDIQDHYGIPADEYWDQEYFSYDDNYFLPQIHDIKSLIDTEGKAKVLDIGAGMGKGMRSLTNQGFDVYGVEASETFRAKAVEKMGIDLERLKLGMMEEVEFENDFFDCITFGAVLEHVYHPSFSIEKAMQWLKPGGIIHIEVPSSDYFIPKLYNMYFKLRGTNYVSNLSPMHEPFHLYEFSLDSFKENAKKLGYSIAQYHYDVCNIYFVPKVFHPILRWYMKRTNKGMQLTVYLKKNG